VAVTKGLARLGAAFKSYEQPGGSWRVLASLTTAERERLDGTLSGLLE
jgi:hypothetical protein